jgi:hypothetical protein
VTLSDDELEIVRFFNFITVPSLKKIFCLPTYLKDGEGEYTGGMATIGLARKILLENSGSPVNWRDWSTNILVRRQDWPLFIENAKTMTVEKYRPLIVINDPPADMGSWKVKPEDIQLHASETVGCLKEIVTLYEKQGFIRLMRT